MSTPPGAGAERDPGLQPERTALSWRRSLLALLVADLFIWRSWIGALDAPHPGSGAALGLGLAAGTAAAATIVFSGSVVLRSRALRSALPEEAPVTAAVAKAATGAVVALAASVLVSVLLSVSP